MQISRASNDQCFLMENSKERAFGDRDIVDFERFNECEDTKG